MSERFQKASGLPCTAVVLCGGTGTRLWPLSRTHAPKQFIALNKEKTLFSATLERARFLSQKKPIILGNEEHRFTIISLLAREKQEAQIILEPSPRNTGPAIVLAALALREEEEDCMLVLPSDHSIHERDTLFSGIQKGYELAKQGYLVTFGIVPTNAETGYGYIEKGAPLNSEAFSVASFIEKPDFEKAAQLVQNGSFLWNSGMFLFSAKTLLSEVEQYSPSILSAVETAWNKRSKDGFFLRPDADAFCTAPSLSIDYAIMERTHKAAVVPLSVPWSDLGSWEALYQETEKDKNGNVTEGDIITEEAHDNYLRSSHRLLAVVGVRNTAVIETADAVLVVSRDKTQKIKTIVDRLKAEKRPECDNHLLVHRPWGSYEILAQGTRFQVKRIIVDPKAELSLQMHHHRAEHWVVVQGTAEVTKEEDVFLLAENESTYIPIGKKHRLKNPGLIPLVIIEIQSGAYVGENDIVRYSDQFGRV